MFGLVVNKELKEILGSTRFVVTFAVSSLLILLTFFLGARSYHTAAARYEAAQAEDLRQMEGETDWLNVRPSVFLPPQPLAQLLNGLANDVGRHTQVMGRGLPRPESSRFGEEPILALFRFVDLEFTFQVVLSLFAILFAFDAVCGERERGTLRLALSKPVPRGVFILGKITGSFLGLTVPLLIPLAMGCLVFLLMGVPMSGDLWLRLGLILLAGLLYVGAVLGLGVFVSSLTRQSSSAFAVLLCLWVLAVLVVPRAAVVVAARAVEVPSVDYVLSQRGRLQSQLWREDQREIHKFLETKLAWSEEDKPSRSDMSASVGDFNGMVEELTVARERRLGELDARLGEERRNRQRWQQRLAFGLARLSPATAFSLAATRLAGTSLELPDYYLERIKQYQASFANFQEEKTGQRAGNVRIVVKLGDDDDGDKPKAIDPRELPAFGYEPPPLGGMLQASLMDLGLLALFNLLFFAGAFVAFLRYDVR